MMHVIQRNLFRLLRSGAFGTKEQIEPMSAYKWSQLYKLSVIHHVAGYAYEGLQACKNQFFLHLTDDQWRLWDSTISEIRKSPLNADDDEYDLLRADHLTNPLLNRRLQTILDDDSSDVATRQLLLIVIRTARHILNEGLPLNQLIMLGTYLRTESHHVDFIMFQKWMQSLRFQHVAQLEASLLTHLLGFSPEEITFAQPVTPKNIEEITQELIESTSKHIQDFQFLQSDDSIFVHTNNGSAMLGHLRRSARYFRYFPSETITNFFASFAHSLSHIEE